MTPTEIEAALKYAATRADVRCPVTVLEAVPSTNTWLSEQAAPAAGEASAVLALHQTAGRGRRGKVWKAPAGSGLCLSLAWTFEKPSENAAALTLALGVAATRALEDLGFGDAMLKWPNDLVWQDRKLGGILVESTIGAGQAFQVIAGIGINRRLPDGFSLEGNTGQWSDGVVDLATAQLDVDLATLASAVLTRWLDAFATFERTPFADTAEAFNRRNWLHDRACELDGDMMRAADVDDTGRLTVVSLSNGQMRALDSGDVVPLAWSRG